MKSNEKDTRNYIFQRGDVICNLTKTDARLILGVKDECYEFMHLKSSAFKDIFNVTHSVEKGSSSSQPTDIVEKHFCIYEIN